MTTAPTIRLGTPDDREPVWRLLGQLAITFEPDRTRFEPTFDALLVDETARLLVAERSGAVVGYLLAHRQATLLANGPAVWVGELVVDATARRSGVGAALMAAMEDWARQVGAAQVALATSRAQAFYGALGYDDAAAYFRKRLQPASS